MLAQARVPGMYIHIFFCHSSNKHTRSFISHNFNFHKSPSSSTTYSSPVFASMVTLLNSLRIGKGKSPLGFLNHAIYHIASDPTLYKQVFNDITSGRNNCCAGAQVHSLLFFIFILFLYIFRLKIINFNNVQFVKFVILGKCYLLPIRFHW